MLCTDSVELVAVRVFIAILKQAARIIVFLLVNITSSFDAEEDTIYSDIWSYFN